MNNIDQIAIKDVTDEPVGSWVEMFGPTIQGEGTYTGFPTVWIRTWGCNLQCPAFSQPDPTDKSTWDLAPDAFDPKAAGVTSVHELPVFARGCDSRHTHDPRYKYLVKKESISAIVDRVEEMMVSEENPSGRFIHPMTEQDYHFAITGGESMMAQTQIVDMVKEMIRRDNVPQHITIETNATKVLKPEFVQFVKDTERSHGIEWLFSMSPKLYNVSGNHPSKAHKPEVVKQYFEVATKAYLKFVVRGEQRVWDELQSALDDYVEAGTQFKPSDVMLMPVGSSLEGQELTARDVADMAAVKGYRITLRSHVYLYGNEHCM